MGTTNRITHDDGRQLTNGKIVKHVNGHTEASAASTSRPGGSPRRPRAQAASDDAHGTPVAQAPGPPAASANHDACADAACDSNSEKSSAASSAGAVGTASGRKNPKDAEPPPALPPGELPLPEDAAAFVSAVHAKADIIEVGRRLLNSKDEKIVKGVWDRLVNLKFGDAEQASDANIDSINMTGAPRPIRNALPPRAEA